MGSILSDIDSRFTDIQYRLDSFYRDRDRQKRKVVDINRRLRWAKKKKEVALKGRAFILSVISDTQEKFKNKVEPKITKAIRAVYDRPYEFKINFDSTANSTRCFFNVKEGRSNYSDIQDDMGTGIIDIISFVLRIVLWSMDEDRKSGVFFFDEPMIHIGKGRLLDRAKQMVKQTINSLPIQAVVFTHEKDLAEIGDKIYEVTHDETESFVSERRAA